MSSTDRDALEELEASVQPDVDGGADGGGPTVEGVGDHQEVVRPD